MRFNRILSWELLAVLSAGVGLGFLGGVLLSAVLYVTKANSLAEQVQRQNARVQLLEGLVTRPPDFSSLDPVEPAPVAAAPAPVPLPRVTQRVDPRPEPLPAQMAMSPVTVEPSREIGRVIVSTPARLAAAPVPIPVAPPAPATPDQAIASAKAPQIAVTPEELASVVAKSRVEGVPASKARVAKITSEGVYLSSGTLVRVGERFSSGERLLKVDPENNRFITSERQLLIFFGA